MDETLERLSRVAQRAPDDAQAARALDAALLRSGQRPAVQARYRLKFRCPVAWEALRPGDHPEVRDCERCRRSVHFVRDDAALAAAVRRGRCVALLPERLASAIEGLIDDPRAHSAVEPGAPCLVEAQEDPLELTHLLLGIIVEEPPTPGSEGAADRERRA